jgi:hypothetical protein
MIQILLWTGVDLSHFKDIMDDNSLIILFKTKFKSISNKNFHFTLFCDGSKIPCNKNQSLRK